MAVNILQAVTALLATWSRHVSRAAKELRSARRRKLMKPRRASSVIPFLGDRREKIVAEEEGDGGIGIGGDELVVVEEEEEVWRRGIIMGEKCQPLDFSGVIYYDSDGRQVAGIPVPRSPTRSPLRSTFLADQNTWK